MSYQEIQNFITENASLCNNLSIDRGTKQNCINIMNKLFVLRDKDNCSKCSKGASFETLKFSLLLFKTRGYIQCRPSNGQLLTFNKKDGVKLDANLFGHSNVSVDIPLCKQAKYEPNDHYSYETVLDPLSEMDPTLSYLKYIQINAK